MSYSVGGGVELEGGVCMVYDESVKGKSDRKQRKSGLLKAMNGENTP